MAKPATAQERMTMDYPVEVLSPPASKTHVEPRQPKSS